MPIAINNIWDTKLQFAQQLMQQDRRNNNAWNHRWFVTHHGRRLVSKHDMLVDGRPGRHGVDLDLYVMTHPDVALRGNANYESPWRYYVAVFKEQILLYRMGPRLCSYCVEPKSISDPCLR